MKDKLNLSRNQIATIVGNDEDAIRQFEKIVIYVAEAIESGLNETAIMADVKSNRALKEISELKKTLGV